MRETLLCAVHGLLEFCTCPERTRFQCRLCGEWDADELNLCDICDDGRAPYDDAVGSDEDRQWDEFLEWYLASP